MNKKLVLFDLDGVILDSKHNMMLSWNAVREKHNIDVKFKDYFENIGRPFTDILDILNIKENQNNIAQTYNKVSQQMIGKLSFYEGSKSVLSQLADKNIKTGIVTSKETLRCQFVLDLLGFEFDIVQTPNEKLQGKPAPDHLLYAMSELGVSAADTIYIGDMNVDFLAAKNAQVDYIHAMWGYGLCSDENTIKLKEISQLMEII
jgi:HAD superfamily hydrolase (TIGR01549 family)